MVLCSLKKYKIFIWGETKLKLKNLGGILGQMNVVVSTFQ